MERERSTKELEETLVNGSDRSNVPVSSSLQRKNLESEAALADAPTDDSDHPLNEMSIVARWT
jgi:hypothetical protein